LNRQLNPKGRFPRESACFKQKTGREKGKNSKGVMKRRKIIEVGLNQNPKGSILKKGRGRTKASLGEAHQEGNTVTAEEKTGASNCQIKGKGGIKVALKFNRTTRRGVVFG